MNYFKDYQQMVEDSYILDKGPYVNEITNLQNKLKSYTQIDDILQTMDEINIYKQVLNVKVHVNILPDPKVPERKYVQVRGAVPIKKGKRVWIGKYMGKKEEYKEEWLSIGRKEVMKKLIDKLKSI